MAEWWFSEILNRKGCTVTAGRKRFVRQHHDWLLAGLAAVNAQTVADD